MTPTTKDTYSYCEHLINESINNLIGTAHLSQEGEALEQFKQELKDLYKHLENIQALKTSYISGR
jgi:Asp-tRNA(Asn)/Glu-tRNA(Gln) amidotransferase C subunit